jgi:hypothetical protein
MSAEVHSLGAYRELSGRPSVDTELAAIREKLQIDPPPPIPMSRFRRVAQKLFGANAISPEAMADRQAGLLNTWFEITASETSVEQARDMLLAKVNLASAIIQARAE